MNKKDHVDYSKRIVYLRRWHESRRAGESGGNVTASRGDESLYKASVLGRVSCSIAEVPAGADEPFSLTYQAGKRGLAAGDVVKFFVTGQGSLHTMPQVRYPGSPGYIEVETPPHVSAIVFADKLRILSLTDGEDPDREPNDDDMLVGPISFGFKVSDGRLDEGQEVTLHIGRQSFLWKKLAGKKRIWVIIEPPGNKPTLRLPEPVVIAILPLRTDHVDVHLPSRYSENEPVFLTASTRDKYDNRTPYYGEIKIDINGARETAHINNGLCKYPLQQKRAVPLQVIALPDNPVRGTASNWSLPEHAIEAGGKKYNLYIGDMHAHDMNSTAEGYPVDVFSWARDEKALDFISVPLQVHRYIDNEKWFLMKHMHEYFLDEGTFVTFLAFEWQHSMYGDKVVHFMSNDMPYLPIDDPRYDSPDKLYRELRKTDAFIISHHPGYELGPHVPGTDWNAVEDDIDRLVEIWSMHGSSEGFDGRQPLIPPFRKEGAMAGLKMGKKFGIVAGSDTHTARPGGSVQEVRPYTGGLCAVWAEELTRRSLFEAFLARRTYALGDDRVIFMFSVNGRIMGSEMKRANTYCARAKVWSPVNVEKLQILRNGELLHEENINGDVFDFQHSFDNSKSAGPDFIHCRLVLENGGKAVCSPVWVD